MKIWSWRQAIEKSTLKPMTKLVLYTLANHMNDHGQGCFPSIPTIAISTGLKERAVFNNIKLAEEAGFLIRKKRQLAGKKWASNEYHACYPKEVHVDASQEDNNEDQDMHLDAGVHLDASHNGVHVDAEVHVGAVKGCTQVHTNSPLNSPLYLYKYDTKILLEEVTVEIMQDFIIRQQTRGSPITVNVRDELERFRAAYGPYGGNKNSKGTVIINWAAQFEAWLLDAQKRDKYEVKNGKETNGNHQSGRNANATAGARKSAIDEAEQRSLARIQEQFEAKQRAANQGLPIISDATH